ncbi:MAG: hypothetical protein SNG69_01365, partial [Rikenellaceae bacterium]
LNVSNAEYKAIYASIDESIVSRSFVYALGSDAHESFSTTDFADDTDMSSVYHSYSFNPYMTFGDHVASLTITPMDPSYPQVTYNFHIYVTDPNVAPAILDKYLVDGETNVIESYGNFVTRPESNTGYWTYDTPVYVATDVYYNNGTIETGVKDEDSYGGVDSVLSLKYSAPEDPASLPAGSVTDSVDATFTSASSNAPSRPDQGGSNKPAEVTSYTTYYTVTATWVDEYVYPENYEMAFYVGEAFNYASSVETGGVDYDFSALFASNVAPGSTSEAYVAKKYNNSSFALSMKNLTQVGDLAFELPTETVDGSNVYGLTDYLSELVFDSTLAGTSAYKGYNKGYGVKSLETILGNDESKGIMISMNDALKNNAYVDYPLVFTTEFVNGETNDFTFTIRFSNPLAIVTNSDAIAFTDYISREQDWEDASGYFAVTFRGKEFVNEWNKPVTRDVEGDLNTSDYVNIDNSQLGSFYELDLTNTYYHTLSKYRTDPKDPWFIWEDVDGVELKNSVVMGNCDITFRTNFAWVTGSIPMTVTPEVVE